MKNEHPRFPGGGGGEEDEAKQGRKKYASHMAW